MFPLYEKYDPLPVDGKLMINENRINWFAVGMILVSLVLIGIAFIDLPESLALLSLFVLIFMAGRFVIDECGRGVFYPVRKKRANINAHGFYDLRHPWYSRSLTEVDAGYKEKLIDYMDYLRQGGEASKTVERHLADWHENAKQIERSREKQKDKDIASMFVNEEQLKAYRKALQDVEKDIR